MNRAELHTELTKVISRAVREGVIPKKLSCEEIIGVLELHKQGTIVLANNIEMDERLKNASPIIRPNGRPPTPP